MATTYPAMPRSWYSGSMASCHKPVARGISPICANRVHTSTRTSCLPSQSMGINGRLRQKTRRVWRNPQLYTYSYGVCTTEHKDQSESIEERQCQHQSESGTHRQWSFGRKRVRQPLPKVRPRALCVPDYHRTDHTLSRMGPHWNAVYIGQGVSRRGCQFHKQTYHPYKRWKFSDWFWWPVRWTTRRLGDEHVAWTRRWIPKSSPQQRLDGSDAGSDVKSRVGARTDRSVAVHSPAVSAPSTPATAHSVIKPGIVADVPSIQRERLVHWGSVKYGYADGLHQHVVTPSDDHELNRCVEAQPIFEIKGEALSVLPQSVVNCPFELHREDKIPGLAAMIRERGIWQRRCPFSVFLSPVGAIDRSHEFRAAGRDTLLGRIIAQIKFDDGSHLSIVDDSDLVEFFHHHAWF